jgi:hypothetical protein
MISPSTVPAFVLLLLLIPATVGAHDGPPFPIIMDRSVGSLTISVWTDPDVGTGTFFVLVNGSASSIPADLKVDVCVQPVSGRLAEASYHAEREDLRDQVQYKALVPLDAEELWRVRVRLLSSQFSGEAIATVEATPPGLGRWDLLIYLLPFVAVGLLWFVAVVRKRSRTSPAKTDREPG